MGSALNLISTGGYYGAYVVVLARTLAGAHLASARFTFLTGAFSRSRSYIEKILSSFNDISEQAMFLKDLFEFFEMEPTIRSAAAAPSRRRARSATGFEFRNVAFAYPGADRLVVQEHQLPPASG